MVTHDVDEAIFLGDRVIIMTNGPESEVGDVKEIKSPCPRARQPLIEDPENYRLRKHLITFLEDHAHHHEARGTAAKTSRRNPKPPSPTHQAPATKTEKQAALVAVSV